MAILEKEVWVVLNGANLKYLEGLGYEIPRSLNNQKRMTVPKGTRILVKVEDLLKYSQVKVTKICDIPDCGKHVLNQKYSTILLCRDKGDGKDRCFNCGSKNGEQFKKNNIKYENSLEFWARENNKEYLINEWSNKNEKNTRDVSKSTADAYLWDCPKCKIEYDMGVNLRKKGVSCPYCRGFRVNHTNCLWTTHPEIAKLLKNPQRGYEVTYGSGKKEEFKCCDCGFEQSKTPNAVCKRGYSCLCSDGIPYPEKIMMSILNQINVNYLKCIMFDWSDRRLYDFYIPEYNMIIETHGLQHYSRGFVLFGGKTLEEEQENDIVKEKLAKENGIIHYITIDCRYSELEFIKNNIISSVLSEIFNLNNVDWRKCYEDGLHSLVKTACSLWDSIGNTSKIGEIVKLQRSTIIRYLKQGASLGWCDYDPKEEMKKNGKSNKKKIVQLTKNGDFVKTWDSGIEASSSLGLSSSNIPMVCSGKQKSAGGFKWMNFDEYEEFIKNK